MPPIGGSHTSKDKYNGSVYKPQSMQDFASLHVVVSKWKPSETEKEGFHQQVIR